jgi:RES domain-containing protein
VTLLYRVFPHVRDVPPGAAGSALFIPPQGGGRLDNPDLFQVLYLSDSAAGAIAEAAVCDLDDARQLLELDLRPSQVVSRVYQTTRSWARRIYTAGQPGVGRWSGVTWWSYYDPRWKSYGLWETDRLRHEAVEALNLDHPIA